MTYERLKNITAWTVIRHGASIESVARDYDISQKQLSSWVTSYALTRLNPKTKKLQRNAALKAARECRAYFQDNPDVVDRESITAQEWAERRATKSSIKASGGAALYGKAS